EISRPSFPGGPLRRQSAAEPGVVEPGRLAPVHTASQQQAASADVFPSSHRQRPLTKDAVPAFSSTVRAPARSALRTTERLRACRFPGRGQGSKGITAEQKDRVWGARVDGILRNLIGARLHMRTETMVPRVAGAGYPPAGRSLAVTRLYHGDGRDILLQ